MTESPHASASKVHPPLLLAPAPGTGHGVCASSGSGEGELRLGSTCHTLLSSSSVVLLAGAGATAVLELEEVDSTGAAESEPSGADAGQAANALVMPVPFKKSIFDPRDLFGPKDKCGVRLCDRREALGSHQTSIPKSVGHRHVCVRLGKEQPTPKNARRDSTLFTRGMLVSAARRSAFGSLSTRLHMSVGGRYSDCL
jgi:hypothetical protein